MDIKRQYTCLVVNPIHGLYLWFPLKLHDGWSDFRLNDGPDVKVLSVGWCLVLVFGWNLPRLNMRFS